MECLVMIDYSEAIRLNRNSGFGFELIHPVNLHKPIRISLQLHH